MGTENYGDRYWCVKVDKSLAENGSIYLHADKVFTDSSGALVLCREDDSRNMVIAANLWFTVFASSVFDGSAVAVDHWDEEVVRQ